MVSQTALQTDRQLQFRLWLQQEFAERCRNNDKFSIRAFAKFIEIDSSALSQILSGKRKVSDKMMQKFFQKLGSRPGMDKKDSSLQNYAVMQGDLFAVISDWHHLAILDLTLLKSFKNDPEWIANKLEITRDEAVLAIARLKRLGMLVERNKKLAKDRPLYTNYQEGETSEAHKEYQRQVIKQALKAVDHCPQDRKDITGMTIAANSKKIQAAKLMIKKFRRELCQFLEDSDADSVYHFTLQLYPVTKKDE